MPISPVKKTSSIRNAAALIGLALASTVVLGIVVVRSHPSVGTISEQSNGFEERFPIDSAGFDELRKSGYRWDHNATLAEIRDVWNGAADRLIQRIDRTLVDDKLSVEQRCFTLLVKASLLNSDGEPRKGYQTLELARSLAGTDVMWNRRSLYSIIYFQGVTALRCGENENCVMCRGESSCIIPISPAAVHLHPDGSRLAIKHFTEYLAKFPEDLEVRWLLNLAHMTLGEHPEEVDPRYLISLDHFNNSEFDIGKFRDIGHVVGLDHFTQAGGAIMDDFDNDGLLDIVITSFDPTCQMNLLRNTGRGTYEDTTEAAGLMGQIGGANCVQTDYNNDGLIDIFVIRGAWQMYPMRPSLLRQNSNATFTDVTEEAGLLSPANSIAAQWADYDNDGWLDLFVCCERQPSRLYHNLGNGTFREVASTAGILTGSDDNCKGVAWIDYDNDGFPDLFNDNLSDNGARLFHNNRDGTFSDNTYVQGIKGPVIGFSCWAWDYDNDGWLDIFATCYDRSLGGVVQGLLGRPHGHHSNRLYRNMNGRGFEDVTKEAGLDLVFSTMGSNFGDFDNDGFLDMYLGTGDPDYSMLVPNRMFKNVAGKRFAEITASSGTGNLQKGHGVACGDWDRDGNVDIFIEMGGAVNGDKYHNILFQNPGHKNNWLTVKLTGKKTNRPAIGARIKVVTADENPQTFHRHVSSGSSFGASPLQQTIGIGNADRIAMLEIHWPTSGTTQRFHDVSVNQAIAITEFAEDYQKLDWTPVDIPQPKAAPKMTAVHR